MENTMQKREYQAPCTEIVFFSEEDVVRTSGFDGEEEPLYGEGPFEVLY